jgi:hypothetical protein
LVKNTLKIIYFLIFLIPVNQNNKKTLKNINLKLKKNQKLQKLQFNYTPKHG